MTDQVDGGVQTRPLVLVSSVEQCAARAKQILDDPDGARALGQRGKEHVRAHFLTPRYLRDYLKIFSEVLA